MPKIKVFKNKHYSPTNSPTLKFPFEDSFVQVLLGTDLKFNLLYYFILRYSI